MPTLRAARTWLGGLSIQGRMPPLQDEGPRVLELESVLLSPSTDRSASSQHEEASGESDGSSSLSTNSSYSTSRS